MTWPLRSEGTSCLEPVLKVSKVTGFRDEGVLLAHIALAVVESGHRFDLARAVFSSAWNASPRWVGLFFHLEVDILMDINVSRSSVTTPNLSFSKSISASAIALSAM